MLTAGIKCTAVIRLVANGLDQVPFEDVIVPAADPIVPRLPARIIARAGSFVASTQESVMGSVFNVIILEPIADAAPQHARMIRAEPAGVGMD